MKKFVVLFAIVFLFLSASCGKKKKEVREGEPPVVVDPVPVDPGEPGEKKKKDKIGGEEKKDHNKKERK